MIVCCFFLFLVSEMDRQFSTLPNMAQLLQFISGHPYLPSSGLHISFSQTAVYSDADSCFFFLQLPTIHNNYQQFKNAMNTAITCQYLGYGRGWRSDKSWKTKLLHIVHLQSTKFVYPNQGRKHPWMKWTLSFGFKVVFSSAIVHVLLMYDKRVKTPEVFPNFPSSQWCHSS